MKTIMKKRRDGRDLPTLRFLHEEALHKGFLHGELEKATRILEWQTSRAEVVLSDQADQLAARASGGCRRRTSSSCPRDSFPLVGFSLVGGCEVAACVPLLMGADDPPMVEKKKALEEAVPALLDASSDLKHFNKLARAMAKDRKKVSTNR